MSALKQDYSDMQYARGKFSFAVLVPAEERRSRERRLRETLQTTVRRKEGVTD